MDLDNEVLRMWFNIIIDLTKEVRVEPVDLFR